MLFKVNQKELDLSAIKAGFDPEPSAICADCRLCGKVGNDLNFLVDRTS